MFQPYVLAFVGENANGILRWWTEQILGQLEKHGFHHDLIDLRAQGWQARLNECLGKKKPEFCFSFQGMGMDMKLQNGENVWSRATIPFFSYFGDNPYHAPFLHGANGPGHYLLYGCLDFLDTYRTFLDGRGYASTFPFGYPENPLADHTPWDQRPNGVLYLKTGVDSDKMRREWREVPGKIRTVMYESAAKALTGRDETIANLCAETFEEGDISWGERRELFLSTCSQVDRYVRAVRAERMVRALMPHEALIIGDWSHLDHAGSRARFAPPIAAESLDQLYSQTRVVVNTSPSVRFGIHERILAGFNAKAAVLSDTTPFLEKKLEKCLSFSGVDIDGPQFADELGEALAACLSDPAMATKIETTATTVQTLFSMEAFIQQLLDYIEIERYRKRVAGWTFLPRPDQPAYTIAV